MRTLNLIRLAPLVLLVGCSGGPAAADAPQDASITEYCQSYQDMLYTYAEELDVTQELWDSAREGADELASVGTPAGTPESARAGFEKMLANHLESDTFEEFREARDGDDRVERVDFGLWTSRVCLTGQVDDCFDNLQNVPDSRLARCED
jgi:hypothetical protein